MSGVAVLIGMLLATVSSVGVGVLFPDTSNPAAAANPLNVTLGVLGVVGAALALLGLAAVYARSAPAGGVM